MKYNSPVSSWYKSSFSLYFPHLPKHFCKYKQSLIYFSMQYYFNSHYGNKYMYITKVSLTKQNNKVLSNINL